MGLLRYHSKGVRMAKKVTPMMEQYLDIKSRHSDELLFFRLGDFYELFNEDALIASRELNITLTGRPTGNEERTPMCGVPFHAAESYIETLVKKGYKVAICEQLEDPKAVKGIVKRDVIQVITPGTVMTENGNDARSNNFLALFYLVKEAWILVFSDVSTGEVIWDRVPQDNISQIYDSLSMYRPAEIIVPEGTILPQAIVDFIHNQFNNVVLSPFTSFESVDSACKLANNHFQEMGLMEEDVLAALGFMLPALFMSFLLASFQRKQSLCVTAALVGALAGVTLFSIPVAILAGIVCGCLTALIQAFWQGAPDEL